MVKQCTSCQGSASGSQLAILILVPLSMLCLGGVVSWYLMKQALRAAEAAADEEESECDDLDSEGVDADGAMAGRGSVGRDRGKEGRERPTKWSLLMALLQQDTVGPKVSAGYRVQDCCECVVYGTE
jgi:hypothetical protein